MATIVYVQSYIWRQGANFAGQDETFADVNKASSEAIEIRDKWLERRGARVFACTIRGRFSPHDEHLQ